jgi:predicted amidohydrolase YtcJ
MISVNNEPDLILHRGLFATLDRSNPTADAVAITNGSSRQLDEVKSFCRSRDRRLA